MPNNNDNTTNTCLACHTIGCIDTPVATTAKNARIKTQCISSPHVVRSKRQITKKCVYQKEKKNKCIHVLKKWIIQIIFHPRYRNTVLEYRSTTFHRVKESL